MEWLPASNPSPRRIVADQNPPAVTEPPVTVNPVGWPSSMNNIFEGKTLPSRRSSPLPLSLITVPVTLNEVPATGFATIGSMTMMVIERTVIDERFTCVFNKSEEPLNTKETTINPSGCDIGS